MIWEIVKNIHGCCIESNEGIQSVTKAAEWELLQMTHSCHALFAFLLLLATSIQYHGRSSLYCPMADSLDCCPLTAHCPMALNDQVSRASGSNNRGHLVLEDYSGKVSSTLLSEDASASSDCLHSDENLTAILCHVSGELWLWTLWLSIMHASIVHCRTYTLLMYKCPRRFRPIIPVCANFPR